LVPTFFAALSAKVFELINGINVLNLFSVVVLCGLTWNQQISVFVVMIGFKFGLSFGIIINAVLQEEGQL
jgi:hypothetical protein